jgi:hypothetical protein
MGNIFSILQSGYSSASQPLIPPGAKFAKVNPTQWQGTWTGTDPTKKPYTISISDVKGYRANVSFNSSAGLQQARVFITSQNTFEIGDSKFILTGTGQATLATVVTDPTSGQQFVEQSTATLKS